MIKFRDILKLSSGYKRRLAQYIGLNLLTAIFGVLSISVVVPFLKVIFNTSKTNLQEVDFAWSPDQLLSWLDFKLNTAILSNGPEKSLIMFSLAIVVMFFLKNLFSYLSYYNVAYLRSAVVKELRSKAYGRLVNLPLGYFSNEKRGDIISKMTNDVKEVEWSLIGAIELAYKIPFHILIPLLTLFLISWQLTLFVLLLLPIGGFIISRLGKKLRYAAQAGQEKLGEVISNIDESLHGLKIIKGFNARKNTESKFDSLNEDHFRLMVKLHRKEFAASPLSEFLSSIIIAAILVVGGKLILSDSINFSAEYFIAYIAMFSQLIPPAKAVGSSFFKIQKGSASLERINEILVAKEEKEAFEPVVHKTNFDTDIAFDDVHFSYGDVEVIKGVSFNIKKGQSLALVGPSGGGKSTLADLLPRFHNLKGGKIKIDGQDIKNIPLEDLRSMIGVVTQESILFNDSIRNNILMGNPKANEKELKEAADIANATEFIEQAENGFDQIIGDRGMNLSGGQKQRLSIARAVLKNPPILILDEATSALDTESEKLVQDALFKLMQNRTSLVIAHRLSTIQHSNQILVVEKGQIVERGNHSSLLSKGGLYKKLVDLQGIV